MRNIYILLTLVLFIVITGCDSTEVDKKSITLNLPEDIPSFVTEKDFKNVDWDRTVTEFDTGTRSDMVGNKNKLGIIGPELKPNKVEKWFWHFWGIDNGEMTVVGYNQNTSNIRPILNDGAWSRNGIGGKVNGADGSMPSNVILPEAGKWALLVYIDGNLFDTLVMEVRD